MTNTDLFYTIAAIIEEDENRYYQGAWADTTDDGESLVNILHDARFLRETHETNEEDQSFGDAT